MVKVERLHGSHVNRFEYDPNNVMLKLVQRQDRFRIWMNGTVGLNLAGWLLPTLSNGVIVLELLNFTGIASLLCNSFHSFVFSPYSLLQG